MNIITIPYHKNSCLGGLDHHYYNLSLFELCSTVVEKVLEKDKHFHQNYITNVATATVP